MKDKQKRRAIPPGRIIALGFAGTILLGAVLLSLPIAQTGAAAVSFFDALFTATSAACVTGLVVVDTGAAWTLFGKTVILLLIQIGGLGVAVIGVAVTLLAGERMSFKDRQLIKESWNVSSYGQASALLGKVLLITLLFEAVGALLSFLLFLPDYGAAKAFGMGVFHAVSAFNNAGFDVLGDMRGLTVYGDAFFMNLLTALLIICGGLGYLVILELWLRLQRRINKTKGRRKPLSLQTKAVLITTAALLFGGMLLLKLTNRVSWMGAFFQSVSARTAGFATWDLAGFSTAGLLLMCLLMFIGASPGSTGGGVKTTTLFALFLAARNAAGGKGLRAFRRKVPDDVISKAFIVVLMAALAVGASTLLLCCFEPERDFLELLFEAVSAFATVGLSVTGTPGLCFGARAVLIVTMFVGRIGPLTIATLWYYKPDAAWSYSEEGFTIG